VTPARRTLRLALSDLRVFAVMHVIFAFDANLASWQIEDTKAIIWGYSLLAPFFAMTYIREKTRNIFAFFVLHMALVLFPLMLPVGGKHKCLMMILLALSIIHSFVSRFDVQLDFGPHSLVPIVVLNTGLIIFLQQKHPEAVVFVNVLVIWVIVEFISYVLFNQTARVDFSIDILSKTTRQPIKTMLRFNNIMLSVFVLIVLGASALAPYFPVWWINDIGRMLLAALRKLSQLGTEAPEPEPPPAQAPPQMTQGMPMLPDTEPTPEWLKVLYDVLFYVAAVVSVAIVLVIFAYVAYRVYKKFYETSRIGADGDTREFVLPEIEKEALNMLRNFRLRMPYFGKSESERIRRMYYKKVRKYISKGTEVKLSDTAGEIAGKIVSDNEMPQLTVKYNIARYGKNDVD